MRKKEENKEGQGPAEGRGRGRGRDTGKGRGKGRCRGKDQDEVVEAEAAIENEVFASVSLQDILKMAIGIFPLEDLRDEKFRIHVVRVRAEGLGVVRSAGGLQVV